LQITEKEIDRLVELKPPIQKYVAGIVEEFYGNLLGFFESVQQISQDARQQADAILRLQETTEDVA
jgi:hypothetical protein